MDECVPVIDSYHIHRVFSPHAKVLGLGFGSA